eukprot:1919684-Amphidinium_carterae.1
MLHVFGDFLRGHFLGVLGVGVKWDLRREGIAIVDTLLERGTPVNGRSPYRFLSSRSTWHPVETDPRNLLCLWRLQSRAAVQTERLGTIFAGSLSRRRKACSAHGGDLTHIALAPRVRKARTHKRS